MKNILLFSFFIYSSLTNAQVKFETSSLQNVIAKAKKENKLIFLQLQSADCKECNDVADKAFESSQFYDALKTDFIFYKLAPTDADRKKLDEQYNTQNVAGTLFLNSDGILIHRYNGTASYVPRYIEQVNIALQKSKEKNNIAQLQKMYEGGNREIKFLETYLIKRKELSQPTDDLLDEYVTLLPADSLRSLHTLQFIADMAPALRSTADSFLRKDFPLFNQAWYQLPLQQRVNINNHIISKSKTKAITIKNISYLYAVANFSKNIYGSDIAGGEKYFQKTFVDYYKAVKDTASFISNAITYYDKFFMTISLTEINKNESIRQRELFKKAPADTVRDGENSPMVRKTVSFAPQTQYYTSELNNGAWALYTMSKNIDVLNKALAWSKRATEFYESPEAMDTYARLLYKTGNKNEAIVWEQKAIDLKRKRGFQTPESEKILEKMKQNSNNIDEYQ